MSEGIWYLLVYTKSPFYSSIFLNIQLGAFRSSSSFCVRLRRPFKALFWEGLYTTLPLWNQALAWRAQPVQSAGWGCSLFKMLSTGNCFLRLGICCQLEFQHWFNILEGASIWTLSLVLGLFMRHGVCLWGHLPQTCSKWGDFTY